MERFTIYEKKLAHGRLCKQWDGEDFYIGVIFQLLNPPKQKTIKTKRRIKKGVLLSMIFVLSISAFVLNLNLVTKQQYTLYEILRWSCIISAVCLIVYYVYRKHYDMERKMKYEKKKET